MNDEDSIVRLVVISVPPAPLLGRLIDLRREMCALADSHEALRYPVHLTLRTGALVPENELPRFLEFFAIKALEVDPFSIRLGGLIVKQWPAGLQQGADSCFAGFEIETNPGLLRAHERLLEFEEYQKGRQYEFRPHLTLAFDDLSPEGLESIRAALADRGDLPIGEAWTCTTVECYRQRGGVWEEAASLPLKGGAD